MTKSETTENSNDRSPPIVAQIIENLTLDNPKLIVDLGATSPNVAYQLARNFDAKILFIPLNNQGMLDDDPAQKLARHYTERLLKRGLEPSKFKVFDSAQDLPKADIVLSIGSYGDKIKFGQAGDWFERLIGDNTNVVMAIKKGSGGYPFLNAFGNVETTEKYTENDKEYARVVMSANATSKSATKPPKPEKKSKPEKKAEPVAPEESWREVAQSLIGKDGFYRENEEHNFTFIKRSDTLVVTFDNLDIAMNSRTDRRPWGFSFIEKNNFSMLGAMANGWTWYRDPWVTAQFDELRDTHFFDQFKRVVFYGASMGGYAALAFSASHPGSDAVVFSPQTTLDKSIVPWETRYRTAWDRDYSDHYGDAAETIKTANNIFVFYDPYAELDNRHAKRLAGSNVHHYKAPLMGHRIGSSFLKMGILQPLIISALEGNLTQELYRELFAARKTYRRYLRTLLEDAIEKGHPKRALITCNYAINNGHADDRLFVNTRTKLMREFG